jgi:hypothetical protein
MARATMTPIKDIVGRVVGVRVAPGDVSCEDLGWWEIGSGWLGEAVSVGIGTRRNRHCGAYIVADAKTKETFG